MGSFEALPDSVIDYVREIFAEANERVSKIVTNQPNSHEEALDHHLIFSVDGHAATLFAEDQIAVDIETHWLGGRRMYGRWEIADIAVFVLLRRFGQLEERKVALLQTKRLYSREIAVSELDDADFVIGVGRLADRTGRLRPLTQQRAFSFTDDCVYGAMSAGSQQVQRIDDYIRRHQIPVYYALYNPLNIPAGGLYPHTSPLEPSLKKW